MSASITLTLLVEDVIAETECPETSTAEYKMSTPLHHVSKAGIEIISYNVSPTTELWPDP
jgi:hypothetical protein